ncbi:MAG: methylated-DNA--[protein]-cysteine S-methyltransferase [Desulfopila sp.]|jgi:AraC family transcriptional regulator of adaptative response/methylated-DNA-[protein]-cysteine methyltransferase|nr:methylated-DNA--[protein]-cysteine S-methyltransferase [Desulfopila sp.]
MEDLLFQEKYEAIKRRDSSYECLFFTAVKTTRIFCRPSCRARTPKAENVIFYGTTEEAIQNGYRPCKVCNPMEKLGETPQYIRAILQELQKDPYVRIKDHTLRDRGLDPAHIRRWFKKHHNITFQCYQRMIRINSAFKSIRNGESVTDSAFDCGYESLSGFNASYRSIFGEAPTGSEAKTVVNIVRFTTPLGPMFACASDVGICLLDFTDRRMLETEFRDIRKRLNAVILPGKNHHLDQVQRELHEFFSGKRRAFTVSLDTPGTDFQQAVWRILQEIPYGSTRSYKEQAEMLGNPRAVRAVASANGHNRVSIIIPCHRVVGSDGSLTGYGGGLHRKQWLLDFERANTVEKHSVTRECPL